MPESPRIPVPAQAEAPTLAHDGSGFAASPREPGTSVGNYDLLEEIGRGGMGVVFRARQRALNRVVALKMILAGQLASADDVRRFRTEAEAAALLDHPNIVPVYEVGEQGGQHFFACKLIEGGALSQHVPRLVADPKATAQLLAKVARAVQHAHERGVLHRDLKPANILVDAQNEPHVADFGLARRTGDAGQTQSGAIVGTPAYMAPEQARAEKGLTTAADVYSLGAVLYECLTGKPPFHSESAFETILDVISKEPTPPRQLNAAVDPELEAVCLKCLAKDPQQRYASAAALAEDLDAWLAGNAVSARPPTTLGRLRNWLRKDFRTAILTILLGCALGVLFSVANWPVMHAGASMGRVAYATFFPSETPTTLALIVGSDAAPMPSLISTWEVPTPSSGWALRLAGFGGIMAITFGGLLNAWVLRPKTAGAALSSGLATGLIAAVVSILLGFGWTAMGNTATRPVFPELVLLADGYRAEAIQRQAVQSGQGSTAVEEWDRQLGQAHPDLTRADFPRQERGRALAYKILADLWMNLMMGLWYSFVAAGLIAVVPMVAQTALTQGLIARGDRAAMVFLHYLELALPGTFFLLLVGLFMLVSVYQSGGQAALHLVGLLLLAVVAGLMCDRVLRWQGIWRRLVVATWVVAGMSLATSYLYRAIPDYGLQLGPSQSQWNLICLLGTASLTGTAMFAVFVKRWRWYVRFGSYLGIVLATVTVLVLRS